MPQNTPPQNIEAKKEQSSHNALPFDFDEYKHHLEDSDLTEEQQRELLETLWNILVQFIDLGFKIPAVQEACDQSSYNKSDQDEINVYSSSDVKHMPEEEK